MRKPNRNHRRTMQREIAQYRSHADLLEITEILDRYPDAETADLRRVVTRQLAAIG